MIYVDNAPARFNLSREEAKQAGQHRLAKESPHRRGVKSKGIGTRARQRKGAMDYLVVITVAVFLALGAFLVSREFPKQ